MKNSRIRLAALIGLSLMPITALAHTGIGTTTGFAAGFSHPFAGIDHLLAMIAVGLWAAQMGGRATWAVPASFVTVMLLGAILGFTGIAVPYIETGILVSLLVLGLLVAGAVKLPLLLSSVLVGSFALFHGHAHGSEIPLVAGAVTYISGFLMATTLLHLLGLAAGFRLNRFRFEHFTRLAGGVIVVSGLYLAIT